MKLFAYFQFLYLLCPILSNLQFEELQKKSNGLEPSLFIPLLRADKGEAVSIVELKAAVIKAIEVIIDKLNANDNSFLKNINCTRHRTN